jgi:hypothetical protein
MQPPATPVHPRSLPILQPTPQTRGTASHQSPYEQVTQAEYAPYIQQDLKWQHTAPVDTFLSHVFTTRVDQHQNTVKEVASHKALQNRLKKYCERVEGRAAETHRYQPFTELANDAMAALRKKIPRFNRNRLVFCRNDPTFIAGSHAERKPDVVGVWESALRDNARLSVDHLSDKGPWEAPFAWHELLMFVEFKLAQATIVYPQTAQTKPPQAPRRQRLVLIRIARSDPCISHSP